MSWFSTKSKLWNAFALGASLAYWLLVRWWWRAVARPRTLVILNYHGVEAGEAARFERQIRFLQRRWRFLGLEELLPAREGGPVPARAAHVTFDDALQSMADNALPVLRRLGVPATVFVPTGLVEAPAPSGRPERRVMNWETIRSLDGPPCRFESHTRSHRFLNERPADEKRAELTQ